jgi:hypothetical protein
MDFRDTNSHINPSYIERVEDKSTEYTLSGRHKIHVIEMRDGDTMQTQMSVEGARVIAELSPRITVTFHNVSKVISVPAKMIDPSSTERFIQRTLLDNVSGQIHPGQLVALMGPSGKQNIHTHIPFLYIHIICFNRIWKNNITQYISWSSIKWCHW